MRKRAADRVGERYGNWTIIGAGRIVRGVREYLCECGCGRRKLVTSSNLLSGKTTRCQKCQGREAMRRAESRAASKVGTKRGTLTITAWRRGRRGIQLAWRCECGATGWTAKRPGRGCPACVGRANARKRATVRYGGVGYTWRDLGQLIGVSNERARQIHRDHGRAELLRRAGLLKASGRVR